jgi:hypothetical protein
MGKTKALDTFSGDVAGCFLPDLGGFTGQYWYFVSSGTPGKYALKNLFKGDGQALEGATPGFSCLMTGLASGGTLSSGQRWKVTAFGSPQFPNGYRLQNDNSGDGESLDTPILGGVHTPGMQPTAQVTGQIWYFTRIQHR